MNVYDRTLSPTRVEPHPVGDSELRSCVHIPTTMYFNQPPLVRHQREPNSDREQIFRKQKENKEP